MADNSHSFFVCFITSSTTIFKIFFLLSLPTLLDTHPAINGTRDSQHSYSHLTVCIHKDLHYLLPLPHQIIFSIFIMNSHEKLVLKCSLSSVLFIYLSQNHNRYDGNNNPRNKHRQISHIFYNNTIYRTGNSCAQISTKIHDSTNRRHISCF